MSSRRILLEPGTWFAGYHDQPFFVSDTMIETFLAKYGLTDIKIYERDQLGVPIPVNPRIDPKYTETWESWATAKYAGQPRTIEIPNYTDHVDWLLVIPVAVPKPKPADPPKTSEFWPLLAIAGAYAWLTRKRRALW